MLRKRISPRHTGGFTLLELVVVIAVITILVGILLPNLMTIKANSDRLEHENIAKVVQKALNQYYAYEGRYPDIVDFSSGALATQTECSELVAALKLVTDANPELDPGIYAYNETTGAFNVLPS